MLWPAGVVDCLPRHCRTDWNLGPAKGPHESSRIKHVQLRPWVTLAMSWPRWRQAQARYIVPKRWSILSRKLCWRLSIMVKTPARYWLERIWKLRIQHHRQKCPFTILHWFFFADNQATSAQASHRKTYQDQGSRLLDYPVHCQVIVVIQPSNCIQS